MGCVGLLLVPLPAREWLLRRTVVSPAPDLNTMLVFLARGATTTGTAGNGRLRRCTHDHDVLVALPRDQEAARLELGRPCAYQRAQRAATAHGDLGVQPARAQCVERRARVA